MRRNETRLLWEVEIIGVFWLATTAFAAAPQATLIAKSRLSQFDAYTTHERKVTQPYASNLTPVSVSLVGTRATTSASTEPRSVTASFGGHDNGASRPDSESRIENLDFIFADTPALRSLDAQNRGYVDVLLRMHAAFSVKCTGPNCASLVNARIFVRQTFTDGGGSVCMVNSGSCGNSGPFSTFVPANGRESGEVVFTVPAKIYFSVQPFVNAFTIEISSMYVTAEGLSVSFPAASDADGTISLSFASDAVVLPDGSSLAARGVIYTVGAAPQPPRTRLVHH